jgi:hypothetical protein
MESEKIENYGVKNEDCNDVQFGEEKENNNTTDNQEDLSKYTLVDHLDEDEPIPGQELCLFSFLSPEGVLNCNIRALKFRGAFADTDEGRKKLGERIKQLEEKDKYFKIFQGESGKWLEFDPPSTRVEKEVSTNKEHQKILDAQHKQRMHKLNELAGRHKELIDKKDSGKKERITETQKAGAASDILSKKKDEKQPEVKEETKPQKNKSNDRQLALERTKERLRKRLAEKQEKNKVEEMKKEEQSDDKLSEKIKVVRKVSEELEGKKNQLATAEENIAKIKKLLEDSKKNKEQK